MPENEVNDIRCETQSHFLPLFRSEWQNSTDEDFLLRKENVNENAKDRLSGWGKKLEPVLGDVKSTSIIL